MGSCLGRPSPEGGHRLGTSTNNSNTNNAHSHNQAQPLGGGPHLSSTSTSKPTSLTTDPIADREARALAAEERLAAQKRRGGGGGALSRKLEEEQRAGGTGSRRDREGARSGENENEIRRWD